MIYSDAPVAIAKTAVVYVASPCGCDLCAAALSAGSVRRFPDCGKARCVETYDCAAYQDEPHIPTRETVLIIHEAHPGKFLVF
jgi:hypothetical protein